MCFLLSLSFTEWMIFFSDWVRADKINFLIAIGTFLTAGFTYGLYVVAKSGFKKLLNDETRKAQLTIVTGLITELVNLRDILSRRNSKASKDFPVEKGINIFDTSRLNYFPFEENYPLILYYPLKGARYSAIFNYLSNPLLPEKIAKNLDIMRSMGKVRSALSEDEYSKPFFILNSFALDSTTEKRDLTTKNQLQIQAINEWLGVCKNLHRCIMRWFIEQGVTDLNQTALFLFEEDEEDTDPNA